MNHLSTTSRRSFLRTSACGFGSVALSSLLQQSALAKSSRKSNDGDRSPIAAKEPHLRARAKRIIFLFMKGGPSQMDLFDHKPQLQKGAGKELPYELPKTEATVGLENTRLLGPVSGFEHRGECGLLMSDLLPLTGQHADEICVLRAMQADSPNHPVAIRQLHTGNLFDVVPSAGSWLSYGLGTEERSASLVRHNSSGGRRAELQQRLSSRNPSGDSYSTRGVVTRSRSHSAPD